MRYEIGQKIWTVFFHNLDAFFYPSYSQFMPWESATFPEIEFRELTVTEHHKVLNEWANNTDVPDCDGYVLQDDTGRIWHNQFPRASYGQMSDNCDGLFRLFLEKQKPIFEEVLDFITAKRETRKENGVLLQSPHVIETYDLVRELSQISRGHHNLMVMAADPKKDAEALERAHKLHRWYVHLMEQFEKVTGLKIESKPLEFKSTKNDEVTILAGHYRFYTVDPTVAQTV